MLILICGSFFWRGEGRGGGGAIGLSSGSEKALCFLQGVGVGLYISDNELKVLHSGECIE